MFIDTQTGIAWFYKLSQIRFCSCCVVALRWRCSALCRIAIPWAMAFGSSSWMDRSSSRNNGRRWVLPKTSLRIGESLIQVHNDTVFWYSSIAAMAKPSHPAKGKSQHHHLLAQRLCACWDRLASSRSSESRRWAATPAISISKFDGLQRSFNVAARRKRAANE